MLWDLQLYSRIHFPSVWNDAHLTFQYLPANNSFLLIKNNSIWEPLLSDYTASTVLLREHIPSALHSTFGGYPHISTAGSSETTSRVSSFHRPSGLLLLLLPLFFSSARFLVFFISLEPPHKRMSERKESELSSTDPDCCFSIMCKRCD